MKEARPAHRPPSVSLRGLSQALVFALAALAIAFFAIIQWRGAASPAATTANPSDTAESTVTLTRVSSPALGTLRIKGTTTAASGRSTIAATVDGFELPLLEVGADADGVFVVEVAGVDGGARTVCIGPPGRIPVDQCTRVFVTDVSEETPAVVEAHITEAISVVRERFDFDRHVPNWAIEITGPNSGLGGYTAADESTIYISANPGRTLDDYVTTVLHELGHAVDHEYMTPATRQLFGELRGHRTDLPWDSGGTLVFGDDRWRFGSEDFAEVFVAWTLGDNYQTQTDMVAPQPTEADQHALCEMLALDGVTC